MQVRLIVNFTHCIQDTVDRQKCGFLRLYDLANIRDDRFHNTDKYATLALKNALSSLPSNIIAFLGRELLGYLNYLSPYNEFMLINEIFKIIKIYLEELNNA